MKVKDIFARFSGGIAGAGVALAVPHIGCLAALTPLAVGAGASAGLATQATYAAGAMLATGAAAAAWYGFRPSRAACCLVFGETRTVRLKKAAAVAICAFTAAAAINTLRDDTISISDRAAFLESARESGIPLWQQQEMLNTICSPKRWNLW